MKTFYNDKRIVITGASSGIGKDLALVLAGFGARLALLARRKEALESLKVECQKTSPDVMVLPADVSDEAAMKAVTAEILEHWSYVDIVIANAGVGSLNPADDFSLEINRRSFEINVLGMANTLAPFIPSMIQRRAGQLVGVSSLAAFRGLPNSASYSASKAAQARMLESFRVDLRKYGIAVSSIHPGFIKTPMTDHNEFTMPFMLDVRKSSLLVARAIMARRSSYLYPWPMMLMTMVNRLLPNCLYDRILPRLSGGKVKKSPRLL